MAVEQIVVVQPHLLGLEVHGVAVVREDIYKRAGDHVVFDHRTVLQLDIKLLGGVALIVQLVSGGIAADFAGSVGVLRAVFIVLGQVQQQPGGPC